MPITRSILDTARISPNQLALVGGSAGQHLTYAQLVSDSRTMFAAVAALLDEQEQRPVSAAEAQGLPVIAVSCESAFHTARIMAGLAGYPAVSATLDPRWPLDHQVDIIAATGMSLVISDSAELAQALAATAWTGSIVSLAEFQTREAASEPGPEPQVRDGAEPFLMLFSSGTTSNPKAFIKTREQYRQNYAVSSAHLEPLPGVATLAPGPMSYSLTLYAVIECLASGGSAHVADAFDPTVMAHRIEAEGITRFVAVPAVVQSLADVAGRNPEACAGLELVVTGGANLPARIRANLSEALPDTRLISYYGAAEIGFIGDSRGGDGTLLDIYPGIEASVRDSEGREVPDGEIGTLWIQAAACSHGYVAATTDASLVGPDGWASVGDQARIVDGRLELLGRAGDIVITGGHKVSLTQVETAFDDLLGPGRACAVSLPSKSLGQLVALVIEDRAVDSAPVPGKAELRAYAATRLAPQFVPRQWHSISRLPRTVGGKIRRQAAAQAIEMGEGQRL